MRMEEELDAHTLWIIKAHDAAIIFAETCDVLRSSRPVQEADELEETIVCLTTELWDRNFSITAIRKAFLEALEDLPRYAAGHDSRQTENEVQRARERERGKPNAP
jgi:hypothetical protein